MNEYIKLLIKYKNQVVALSCLMLTLIMFLLGRYSVEIPPKSIVCKNELITIEKQFSQLQTKDQKCAEKVIESVDKESKSCQSKIEKAIDNFKDKKTDIDCRVCKAIEPQCKKNGLWK